MSVPLSETIKQFKVLAEYFDNTLKETISQID